MKGRTPGWNKRRRKVALFKAQSWLKRELEITGCQYAGCNIHDSRMLTFHHRDPETKLFDFSQKNLCKKGLGTIKAERAKCDVHCFNHHQLIEWERRVDAASKEMETY